MDPLPLFTPQPSIDNKDTDGQPLQVLCCTAQNSQSKRVQKVEYLGLEKTEDHKLIRLPWFIHGQT